MPDGDAPDPGSRWLFAAPGRLRAPWRLLLYVLALVAAAAVAQGMLYPILAPLARLVTTRPSLGAWLFLATAVLAHALVLRVIERRPFAYVGLGRAQARPAGLGAAFALGVFAIGVPCALLLATGALRAVAAPPGSWWATALSLALALAPAALAEEMLVRGYPLLVLQEAAGTPVAVIATSLVFGALHLTNPGASARSAVVVTLAGVFLAVVRLATGSLWAAAATHLAWNWTLAAGVHAAVSGLPFATPGYRVVGTGPDWLTGGAWGPEGGLAAMAGMAGAVVLVWRGTPRRLAPAHGSDTYNSGSGRITTVHT